MIEHRLHFEIARNEIGNEPAQKSQIMEFKPIFLLIEFHNRCFKILVEIEIKSVRQNYLFEEGKRFLFIIIRKHTFLMWCS